MMTRNNATMKKTLAQKIDRVDVLTLFTILFFCSTYVAVSVTNVVFGAKGTGEASASVAVKYVLMLMAAFFAFLHMMRAHHFDVYRREFSKLFIVFVVFTFVTCVMIIYTGKFSFSMVIELLKIGIPVVLAYCLLNTLTFSQLYRCFEFILVVSIPGYIGELITNGVTVAAVLQSDYATSTSPLESHMFAGLALTLCFFFCYYRRNKIAMIASIAFALAVFKRLGMLFAVFAFFLPYVVNPDAKISKLTGWIMKILFLTATAGYYVLMIPSSSQWFQDTFHQTQFDFSSGRSSSLSRLLNGNFISSGFGSTGMFLGQNMEMDFVKIAFELTPLALVLFICFYWDSARDNLYCCFVMLYEFLNMITSDSLTTNFKWVICFVMFGMILYMGDDSDAMRQRAWPKSHYNKAAR